MATLMLQELAVQCFRTWDQVYHRHHRLKPVGPMLFLGTQNYLGPDREFADGTVLRNHDPIGVLHFNNSGIAALGQGLSRHQAAGEFNRQLRTSLGMLAEWAASPDGAALRAYQGTTWMRPHGRKEGFTIEPLDPGWRTHWLRLHFRMLRLCFSPAAFRMSRTALEPRRFWITRPQLRQHFLNPT